MAWVPFYCSEHQPEKGLVSGGRITYRSAARRGFRPFFVLTLCALLFSLLSTVTCSAAEERDVPLGLEAVDALVDYHRRTGTHMDGPRCPMYPSCASYAHKAISHHGWHGFLIFIDRLFFREGGNLSSRYPLAPRHLSDAPRYLDPLEASLGNRPRLSDPTNLASGD